MQRAILLFFCLPLHLIINGCSSPVKAPVDSRSETPPAGQEAGYSQSAPRKTGPGQQRGYHMVVKGDTLYSIAWRYGYDYRDVALWNDISGKYVIYPGQLIRLKPDLPAQGNLQPGPVISRKKSVDGTAKNTKLPETSKTAPKTKSLSQKTNSQSRKIVWRWPTSGKIVKLNTPTSKKGVDIAGQVGQKVNAAAGGDVVYSGSGLLGYGKLIIIKHNDTFLSAYAHNKNLYAKEGDRVSAGQQIATMGLGNKGRPILHFEIRKDGTPVNPLNHLPRKRL